MLYKLENGKPIPFQGRHVKIKGRIIAPPTDIALSSLGYKRIVEDEKPEYDSQTQELIAIYRDKENYIKMSYEVRDLE